MELSVASQLLMLGVLWNIINTDSSGKSYSETPNISGEGKIISHVCVSMCVSLLLEHVGLGMGTVMGKQGTPPWQLFPPTRKRFLD